MATTAERLREALAARGMKPVDLHEKTGISKASISQYMSGHVNPKQDRIYLMAKALNVDELWLMGHDVSTERRPAARQEGEEGGNVLDDPEIRYLARNGMQGSPAEQAKRKERLKKLLEAFFDE